MTHSKRGKASGIRTASRFDGIEISLIRQINALATPFSINLGIGEPNIEPDETFRDMARRAAGEASWHYSANAGDPALRQLVSSHFAPSYDPRSEICITAGTEEALYSVFQSFVDPGDEVLVPDPGFVAYPTLARLAGGVPVPYPLDPERWTLDVAALAPLLSSRTKLIVVNSPSNPTGGVLAAPTLRAIAAMAAERGVVVVSDEVYREIHYGAAPPSMIGMGENVVVVDGMSKAYSMTGLRLGWAIAREPRMHTIIRAHQYIATCASTFSQALATIVLESDEWRGQWLESLRSRFAQQREAAVFAARRYIGAEVEAPPAAFYLFVPVPTCDSAGFAHAVATEAAVLTVPGVAFGKRGEGFLRISFATDPQSAGEGIERIGRYLDEIGR
ncbi:MAG: pyridoxal phosphate-dependent aminotransferase [Thermoanaerobaculia bacterium]